MNSRRRVNSNVRLLVSMNLLRRYTIFSGIAAGLLTACVGSYVAELLAIHHTHEIGEQVRAHNPNDPLDGLWIIGLWIMLAGSILATLIGVGAGLIVYVELKRSAALHRRVPVHRKPLRKLYQ